MSPNELIDRAFDRLAAKPGFVERADQRQLARLVSDCIESRATGAFEAPTGLGKSVAALVPAIAHAIVGGKRTVIATYTNVLAEQYWRSDMPLAVGLFDESVRTEFLIGRQRYACLAAMSEMDPVALRDFHRSARLGIESEFRQMVSRQPRELTKLWQAASAPPVCPARLCSHYGDCHYYRARRSAERAHVVITNHSVVLQDALLCDVTDGELNLLGEYDFLVVDEAHDFAQAAQNALEFELSQGKLGIVAGIVGRIESMLMPIAANQAAWAELCAAYRRRIESWNRALASFGGNMAPGGILAASPPEVAGHPQVHGRLSSAGLASAKDLADEVARETESFIEIVRKSLAGWAASGGPTEKIAEAGDAVGNYLLFLHEIGAGCEHLFSPQGVAVSYSGDTHAGKIFRHDVLGLAEPLRRMLWQRTPYACLSATLALDGNFEFFRRSTGVEPEFEEILPSPFDFAGQAAIYLPPPTRVPDPAEARKSGKEDAYFAAIARELSTIIRALEGRTLALFHSRREMEAVRLMMDLPSELPVLTQRQSGAASSGERFLRDERASLFALRSFWTGFDAPGPTLSCVALVRIPFEVPVDPPQVTRLAWLQLQGLDAFQAHTLPLAKMLMRQGAGRLIRRTEDRGVIALLDPRLRTKRYGEEILANLPRGMRTFEDIHDAMAQVGLHVLREASGV